MSLDLPPETHPGLRTNRLQLLSSASVYVGLNACLDLAVDKELIFALRPGIQIALSPTTGIGAGVIASIAQLYCILLSILVSVNRQQLSLFDANYALTISSSPFTIYLTSASIGDLLGLESGLFKQIESHRRAIRISGALLLPLWLGLRLTLRFSSRAFIDSELCSDVTTSEDIVSDFIHLLVPFLGPTSVVQVCLLALIIEYLPRIVMGWPGLMADFRVRREGASQPQERFHILWTFVKCAWYVSIAVGARSAESDAM